VQDGGSHVARNGIVQHLHQMSMAKVNAPLVAVLVSTGGQ
jgi:hypothetical protein